MLQVLHERPFWLFLLGLVAASFVSISAYSILVEDANEAKRDRELLCEAINGANSGLRNLLVSARAQTPPERMTAQARRFYREQLRALKPLDCANFDRDSLRRQQREAERARKGGDAPSAGRPGQQPP